MSEFEVTVPCPFSYAVSWVQRLESVPITLWKKH
jgi:hypothetical protein